MSIGLQTCVLALISACGFWYASTDFQRTVLSPSGTEYQARITGLEHGLRIVFPSGRSVPLVCERSQPVYDSFGNPIPGKFMYESLGGCIDSRGGLWDIHESFLHRIANVAAGFGALLTIVWLWTWWSGRARTSRIVAQPSPRH